MAAPIEERSILSRIAEAAERVGAPESEAIANAVLGDLSAEELHALAVRGLRHYVGTYFSKARLAGEGSKQGATKSARWDAVKADQQSGELDLARFGVYTGRSRKWLLDCNAEDLLGAADWHRERGDAFHRRSDQFAKLANHLKRQSGAKVVGDLVQSKVVGVLNA